MAKRKRISSKEYLKGLKEITENLQNAVDDIEHGSVTGLADALLYVATESQQKAPVDTGDLRGSVLVELDDVKIAEGIKNGGVAITGSIPDTATVGRISYNAPYAANQHEHTEYDHPRGGQAKYLESVLVENKDRILNLIAGKVEF